MDKEETLGTLERGGNAASSTEGEIRTSHRKTPWKLSGYMYVGYAAAGAVSTKPKTAIYKNIANRKEEVRPLFIVFGLKSMMIRASSPRENTLFPTRKELPPFFKCPRGGACAIENDFPPRRSSWETIMEGMSPTGQVVYQQAGIETECTPVVGSSGSLRHEHQVTSSATTKNEAVLVFEKAPGHRVRLPCHLSASKYDPSHAPSPPSIMFVAAKHRGGAAFELVSVPSM